MDKLYKFLDTKGGIIVYMLIMTLLTIPIQYFIDTACMNSDKYRNVRYITYSTTPNYSKLKNIKTKNESISFSRIGEKEPIVIAQYDRALDSDENFVIGYNSSKKAQKQVEKFAKENSLAVLTDFVITTKSETSDIWTSWTYPVCFDRFFILGKKISPQKNKELSFSKSIYKDSITYDKKHKRIKLIYNRRLEKKNKNSLSSSTLFHNMLFDILNIVQRNGYSIKSISSEGFDTSDDFWEFSINIK